ncbi:MAG: hypothetical protein HYZ12_03790 [Thaumarchaeota archaeon]|nr:hypothetical protein [Nitrososphaerota archaeon]
MKVRFDLSLKCEDEAVADKLRAVLLPDNKGFPKDQGFTMALEGSTLKFRILSRRVMPALSTVESILLDANLFHQISRLSI